VEEGTPRRLLRALQVPEGPVLFEDRGGRGCPVLELLVDAQPWSQVEHLSGSQSFDTHYVAGADEDGRLWLQFGDGVHGREVPLDPVSGAPEVELELRYAVGDPLAGNCARDTLTEALAPTPGSADEDAWRALGTPVQVTNCIPGSGGQAPEPKEAARLRIPASLRHGPLQRAVSLEDYATLAKGLPEVARATARAIDGPFNGVEVLVDPEHRAGLDEPLRGRVQAALEAGRMAARETWVVGPTYVPLEVELSVCPEPGQLPHRLRDRVDAALRPGSAERPGFFHPDRLSFGQDLRLSELLAVVQGLPGVRSVKALRCRRQGSVDDPRVMDRIVLAGTEVARLDADPEVPEHGTLVVRVVGMEAEPIADYRVQTAAGADT
jgi:predicted phage baseplate assembly protein